MGAPFCCYSGRKLKIGGCGCDGDYRGNNNCDYSNEDCIFDGP